LLWSKRVKDVGAFEGNRRVKLPSVTVPPFLNDLAIVGMQNFYLHGRKVKIISFSAGFTII